MHLVQTDARGYKELPTRKKNTNFKKRFQKFLSFAHIDDTWDRVPTASKHQTTQPKNKGEEESSSLNVRADDQEQQKQASKSKFCNIDFDRPTGSVKKRETTRMTTTLAMAVQVPKKTTTTPTMKRADQRASITILVLGDGKEYIYIYTN